MELARVFSDHMVLQREKPILIHGTGVGQGEISFLGEIVPFTSEQDHWEVTLCARPAGGPYTMTVTLNSESTVLRDILIGDVFLCGGQSNMALHLSETMEHTGYSENVRLYNADVDDAVRFVWFSPTEQDRYRTSAIAMHFALMLQREYGVPVGILSISQGSSRMQSWTPKAHIYGTDCDLPVEWQSDDAVEMKINAPGYLWEDQLMSAAPFSIRGVLWYQGESNALRYEIFKFSRLFENMVASWREVFRNPELPFFTVALEPVIYQTDEHDEFGAIRLAQLHCANQIPGVYLTSIGDLGEYGNIHPYRKREVARRLFLAVLRFVYGRTDIEYSGPVFEKMELDGNNAIISFTHAEGLFCAEKEVADLYAAAGENTGIHNADVDSHIGIVQEEQFVPATGKIVDGKLVVHADGIIPRVVKYSYHSHAPSNLFNAEGLPAATFRATVQGLTDPLVTVF